MSRECRPEYDNALFAEEDSIDVLCLGYRLIPYKDII